MAAILKSGLRIMPHSGGRVGSGIYFASENSKSAGYGENAETGLKKLTQTFIAITILDLNHTSVFLFLVHPSKNTGVMFLSEVALGKEHTITKDNGNLVKAPAGYDSVVARGEVEPGKIIKCISCWKTSLFIKYMESCSQVRRCKK